MPRICVTADDYGMHATVNAAIEELAANGHITAAAVMVHRDADLRTLDTLVATGVSVGLHVVMTQEAPLLREVEGTPLAREGRLPETPYQLGRLFFAQSRVRRLLAREVSAQAERYASLGLPFNFVNSHEHVHEVPFVWNAIAEVIEQRRPMAIRVARSQPLSLSAQGALTLLSKASAALRPLRSVPGVLSPLGVGQAGAMTLHSVQALVESGLDWHRNSAVLPELVVHPALDDRPLHAKYGAKTGARRLEHDLLQSAELRDFWQCRGIELTSPRWFAAASSSR